MRNVIGARHIAARALVIAAISATTATTTVGAQDQRRRGPDDGVFVVGSLHRLHDSVSAFGFPALAKLIAEIAPQVMVLETRPLELQGKGETPGRPEYPRVVWKFLKAADVAAFAMEPDGAQFDSLVGSATAVLEELQKRDPATAAFWRRYEPAFAKGLSAYWTTPAATHDSVTALLSQAFYVVQAATLGRQFAAVQDRWDSIMIERAAEVVRANPGKRVLILASYRNRHRFVEALQRRDQARLVDMHQWITVGQRTAQ